MPDRCCVSLTPALTSHLRTTGGKGGTRGNHLRHQAQSREAGRPVDRPGPGWAGAVDATPMLSPRVDKETASSPWEHTPFVRTDVTPGPVAELPSWISSTGAVTAVPAPAGAQELPATSSVSKGCGVWRGGAGVGWRIWEGVTRGAGIRKPPSSAREASPLSPAPFRPLPHSNQTPRVTF